MKRFIGVCASLFLTVALVGCGPSGPKKPEGLPELFPCSVTLTNGGAPVDGAIVTLCPVDASNAWSSTGVTDQNGVAEIMTYGDFPGAPVGQYKVTAMKSDVVVEDNPMGIDAPNNGVYEASDVGVDKKYNYEANTPLELEVKSGDANAFTFELE